MKISWRKVISIYLITFGTVMLIYNSVNRPDPTGEWDDYSLPVASILNGNGFTISESDVAAYKTLFPEWAERIDNYELSFYTAKNGGQMPWYFPVYSVACIPFTLLLQTLELPTIYAFAYTNLTFFMISLFAVWKCLHVDEKKKILLVALLSINPIVFYIGWVSSEVLIYSLLIMGFVAWYNHWYRRAAILISVAGMMNPTIMSIGFFMIAEYLVGLFKRKESNKPWNAYIKEIWFQVVGYGSCYIIGLVPMAYNYYEVGHINLTAALVGVHWTSNETTLERFFSYLLDLNYGILPYFCTLLIAAVFLCIPAILHRHWRYLEWIAVFAVNVFLYSVMPHINHGMSGIARYNVWGVLPLLFAICLFFDEILNSSRAVKVAYTILSLGLCITGVIVFGYGPYLASNTDRLRFTPIAEWFLDYMPSLYNPLPSTFCSRNNQIDGAYSYTLPIIYYDEEGFPRKILLDQTSTNYLKYRFSGNEKDMEWLNAELDKVTDMTYLSIGPGHFLTMADIVPLKTIWLAGEKYNAEHYAINGISHNEVTHSWTDGNEVDFMVEFKDICPEDYYYIHISVNGLINDKQQVTLFYNEEEIYSEELHGGTEICAPLIGIQNGTARFSILLPDAVSPKVLGIGEDTRELALSLISIQIGKKLQ